MCGRFSLVEVAKLQSRFEAESDLPLKPRYNIAPTQTIPIIKTPGRIEEMKWGIQRDNFLLINSRTETIAKRPIRHPCLIPADGFFEWKQKDPYRFILRSKGIFAFAGVFDPEKAACAIITTTANELIRPVHDRMPVILDKQDEKAWLAAPTAELLKPYPAKKMEGYQVSRVMNSSRLNSIEAITPLS